MGSRPYWQRPARTLKTLENRIARLVNPPEMTLLEKVRLLDQTLSLGSPPESDPPYDPEPCVETEIERCFLSRCGAKTRKGTPCKRRSLPNGRCLNHGGLSTGPRTPEGRLRALANLRQFQGDLGPRGS